MDAFFKKFRVSFLEELPRSLPFHLPVKIVGYLPKKKQIVRSEDIDSRDLCFSFILSGNGYFWHGNKRQEVKAPCVFTPADYPNIKYKPAEQWEELYLVYDRSLLPVMEKYGYVNRERMIWSIKSFARAQKLLEEIQDCLENLHHSGHVDRLDAVCELLIRETILSQSEIMPGPEYPLLVEIRNKLEKQLDQDIDLQAILKKTNMTDATFRRCWAKYFKLPPKQYVLTLRMEHACRLLTETDLRVSEIADQLGFRDPLYFSRIFHEKTGRTALEYRKQFGSVEAEKPPQG